MLEQESAADDNQYFVYVHLRRQVFWFHLLNDVFGPQRSSGLESYFVSHSGRVSREFCLHRCAAFECIYVLPPTKVTRRDAAAGHAVSASSRPQLCVSRPVNAQASTQHALSHIVLISKYHTHLYWIYLYTHPLSDSVGGRAR